VEDCLLHPDDIRFLLKAYIRSILLPSLEQEAHESWH
jgi:hypothetical protein